MYEYLPVQTKLINGTASSNSQMFLIGTFLILAVIDDMQSLDEFEIGQIRPWTTELAALQRMKKNNK